MNKNPKSQRYHAHQHQKGRLLVPHGVPHHNNKNINNCYYTGFLVSINPLQNFRAIKEMRQLLDNILICFANHKDSLWHAVMEAYKEEEKIEEKDESNEEDENNNNEKEKKEPKIENISDLLAAELQQDDPPHHNKRGRDEENNNHKHNKNKNQHDWFKLLDCNCKGFLFFQIPFVHLVETALQTNNNNNNNNNNNEKNENNIASHAILFNPLVSHFVHTLFTDKMLKRLIFSKFCFRLSPVELTCCPTESEMMQGIALLLNYHFPNSHNENEKSETDENNNTSVDLHRPLPPPLQYYNNENNNKKVFLHKIVISFQIKNNSNMEAKKVYFLDHVIKKSIPQNRFIILNHLPTNQNNNNHNNNINIIHQLSIVVLHATCGMGIQLYYNDKKDYYEYNMHNVAKENVEEHLA